MLVGKFIFMLLMSSLFIVNCGDDEDDDDSQDTTVNEINKHSTSEVITDETVVYSFPRLSDFLSDTRLKHYWLSYQCFEYEYDHGGKLVVQARNSGNIREYPLEDSIGSIVYDPPTLRGTEEDGGEEDSGVVTVEGVNYPKMKKIASTSGQFWGCSIEGHFSGKLIDAGDMHIFKERVRCTGNLTYEKGHPNRWGELSGNTRITWLCKANIPSDQPDHLRLRYRQQVACEELLMRPPTSDRADDCQVRVYDYDTRGYGSISMEGGEALFDIDSHLTQIDGLADWDSDCCHDEELSATPHDYKNIYEASTMAMKKAMLAVWEQSSLLWNP